MAAMLPLRYRLLAGFCLPTVLVLTITALGCQVLASVSRQINLLQHADALITLAYEARSIQTGPPNERRAPLDARAKELLSDVQTHCDALRAVVRSDSDRKDMDAVQRQFDAWHTSLVRGVAQDDSAAHQAAPDSPQPPLEDRVVALRNDLSKQTSAMALKGMMILLTAAAAAVMLSLMTGLLLSRQIVRPVQECVAAAEALASGDFDAQCRVRGTGELAQLATALNCSLDSARRARDRVQGECDPQPVGCGEPD